MTSETQWKNLRKDSARFQTYIWLSAKEGDVGDQLGQLDHWPESVAALEDVLRDFYIGLRLEKDTKPWSALN